MRRILFPLLFVLILLYSSVSHGVGGGDIVFKPPKMKKVIDSLDFHVRNLGLACQKCHSDLYKMIKGMNEPVTMAEMNQGKSCGFCHHGKGAFATKEYCSICSSMIFTNDFLAFHFKLIYNYSGWFKN